MSELVVFDMVYKRYARRIESIKSLLVRRTNRRWQGEERDWALAGVSFELMRGQSLGIVGPNGAGKSTILRLIQRTTVPDRGRIVTGGSVSSVVELGAGFHPDLTGIENLSINAAVFGLTPRMVRDHMDEIIEFSELGEALDWPVRSYSSGMIARLAFSVLTQARSDLLCIDEVLSVGDHAFQSKSFGFLQTLKERGGTFIIVSHSIGFLRQLCEEVLILRDGKVDNQGPADEMLDLYIEQESQ